jgi:wyosine [tRNA(Phe)-imidazoG37] synthetase (radical SAM superfamily)
LAAFGARYPGRLWLEVMLVSGINTGDAQIEEIFDLAGRIGPDLIHLNTVIRPPADARAKPVDEGALAKIAALCGAKVEVVSSSRSSCAAVGVDADTTELIGLLARRPCTAGEISDALSVHPTIVVKELAELVAKGVLCLESKDSGGYYHLA